MRVTSNDKLIAPFHLIRWFSITALASIVVTSIAAAWFFSGFLSERMIRQDAEVTAGFVRSVVATENGYGYFEGHPSTADKLQDLLDHLNRIPGVLRINVYSAERYMVWSTDTSLIGERFANNDELEEALRADLVVHSGVIDPSHLIKPEHQHLAKSGKRFVESYIPIFDVHDRRVVGVVELYKVPSDLFDAISAGTHRIWLAAAITGIVLYVALFWIVRRAHLIIEAQSDKILEAESLAVVGEMGSAVAHGLRNPLASIRSSAELSLESNLPDDARECTRDIIAQVDRLEAWVRQLLTYAKPAHSTLGPVEVNALLREVVTGYTRDLDNHRVKLAWDLTDQVSSVRGDGLILTQLIGNLVSNALEAMPSGGELKIATRTSEGNRVTIEVGDTGIGIGAADMGRIFRPFFTTKPRGLGLGLPLVRRVVERLGGTVELESQPQAGTTIRLNLPVWP